MAETQHAPKFASQAEEAQWWFEHRDKVAKAFEEAAAAGALRTGTVARLAREQDDAAR